MVEKLRIALAMQPLATALFANCPLLTASRPAICQSARLDRYRPETHRHAAFAFEDGFGFEHMLIMRLTPMYFVVRDGAFINTLGMNFRDFLSGELPALPVKADGYIGKTI